MTIIFGILLFSFLIFIHELGHFLAAKASGVRVNEFAMFMGPAIIKKQVGETLYSLRCIPIGGYCAMEGENEDTDDPHSFQKAAWWKRLVILVAGSFMNLLTGVVIFAILILPAKQIVEPAMVEFQDCCIFCHQDGLQVGDVVVELDGEKIYTNPNISTILTLNPKVEHDITVLRDGKKITFENLEMAHTHTDENGQEYLHYGFSYGQAKDVNFLGKLDYVRRITFDNVRSVRLSLQMLLSGQAGLSDMTGPVGIVQIMNDSAQQAESRNEAFQNMLYIGGFLAINLAIMNMLPIPALDGGRVVGLLLTVAIEKITRKKLDAKYEGYIHGIGMVLLLILMAVILFKDVFMIFKR
ncbi:MAG: site-2 protease family protein [Oscillospiraceae bacterium]|nr:site-2 protease family protein [Oscillospiraceae bacterium]